MIPYGRQLIDEKDIAEVVSVLKSDFLTQGPKVPEFERAICSYTLSKFAVATNSATSSLHIALIALGVKSGDRVWTSPNTFVATSNAALNCGAIVDFVDIDENTLNISISELEKKLVESEVLGTLPKVLIPVHFAGESCDMLSIARLAKRYNFRILEDASHAVGGSYDGSKIGSCKYSDITVFSFHPVKIITTAEGGIATTNDSKLAQAMELLRSHGVTRDVSLLEEPSNGGWYYEQQLLGYNYRMTDLQAALGISQLSKVDGFVNKRHQIADKYQQSLKEFPIKLPNYSNCSALHLFPIRFQSVELRKKAYEYMRNSDIGVNVHYIPVHTQPYYRKLGFSPSDFPVSVYYYSQSLSIPIHPSMSDYDFEFVVDSIRNFFL